MCNFLIAKGFTHNPTLPCIFTYSISVGFVIVAVYIDDLNIIGTFDICQYTQKLLIQHFDIKLLDKTIFCFGLQIHHLLDLWFEAVATS